MSTAPAEPACFEPDPLGLGSGRLRQIVAYGRQVYKLRQRLGEVRDGRKNPKTDASQIAAALFFTGLLRIRSFNALEPRLSEKPFLRLVGKADAARLCSADTLSRALRMTDLESVRALGVGIVAQAERNKVFREGWHRALRYVALDGWEPIQSWGRHCEGCLVRKVKKKDRRGEVREVEQYYHRFVVAMLIDERFDLMLDFEAVLTHDLRPLPAQGGQDEGELTAAMRLLRRVKQTYGWLDVVVADGLYANGPFFTLTEELRMGAVVVARKEGDEPLKEARRIWSGQAPQQVLTHSEKGERVELWDCPDLQTLDTYKGSIRMVLGRIQSLGDPGATGRDWALAVTGCAKRLPADKVLAVARGRWHIENTGFHQWSVHWRFTHVFTHSATGLNALYWIFFAAYDLLTLFLYRQLRCYGRDRGKDVTRTIRRLVDEMLDDLARLDGPVWDTS